MEGYHDGSTVIPLEHAEVCAWDIAECELDEDTRKSLSTITLKLTLTGGLAESTEKKQNRLRINVISFLVHKIGDRR